MTKVKGKFLIWTAVAVISGTILTSCDLRVKTPVIRRPQVSADTTANGVYPEETPICTDSENPLHSDDFSASEAPAESPVPGTSATVKESSAPADSNTSDEGYSPEESSASEGSNVSEGIPKAPSPGKSNGDTTDQTENTSEANTGDAESTAVVSPTAALPSEKISNSKAAVPSSQTTSTAKVASTSAPVSAPTPTSAPATAASAEQSSSQDTHTSNVKSIVVGTVAPVKKTPVPDPTPARNSAFYSERCSMTDYTKQALPGEKYQSEVAKLLSSAAKGESISIPTSERADIEAFLYSHRYLTGVSTIVLYSSGNGYTIEFSFDNSTKISHYKSTLDWAAKAVSKLGITKNTLKKDALNKINKYVCEYITYDHKKYDDYLVTGKYDVDQDVWSAINSKCGICEHYAQMFMLICHKCGIEAYYEANYNMSHAYNYVIFGDGTRYYFDCTWNDSFETATFNIGSASYVGLTAAADGLWANDSPDTIKRFGNGLVCDKQGFIDYHSNLYLGKYSLLPRNDFISAHSGWSLGNRYYSYESHDY